MRKLYATSALFALAVASVVWAQPPAKTDPPGTKSGTKTAEPPKKVADPTDAAIAAALNNDAAMKIARAKLQLAEAELAQAKQAVTLRVITLKAQIESLKAERDASVERVRLAEARVRTGQEPQAALVEVRITYEKVIRALAIAEAELKLLTGDGTNTTAIQYTDAFRLYGQYIALAHDKLLIAQQGAAPVGPVSERIRAALDRPVSLKGTFPVAAAVEVLKDKAKFEVAIRGLDAFRADIAFDDEQLPLGALLQLIQDQTGLTAYVREYGILFAKKESAPADAVTLTQFWKQKPTSEPAPAPKK